VFEHHIWARRIGSVDRKKSGEYCMARNLIDCPLRSVKAVKRKK
jgi:hypothetical protein